MYDVKGHFATLSPEVSVMVMGLDERSTSLLGFSNSRGPSTGVFAVLIVVNQTINALSTTSFLVRKKKSGTFKSIDERTQ